MTYCKAMIQMNRGVLKYYISWFSVTVCLQLCNGGSSFFGLSWIKHLFLLHLPPLEKKPGLGKTLLWFLSWYSKTLWTAAARGKLQHLLGAFPTCVKLSSRAVRELYDLAGKGAHLVFKMDLFRCHGLKVR